MGSYITDHHTKFVYVAPIHFKSADQVMEALQTCFTYGFPQKIISDNGKEFNNKKMQTFCKENSNELAHGAPRTLTTQGLVERSNRSWKEDMRALISSVPGKDIKKWCKYVSKDCYIRFITYHRAIKVSTHEAVYGFKPYREKISTLAETSTQRQQSAKTTQYLETNPTDQRLQSPDNKLLADQLPKRQKLIESQTYYIKAMVKQTRKKEVKKSKFKVGDMVSIKINRVNKTTPLHPNLLLRKITAFENTYAKVVTQSGIICTLICFEQTQFLRSHKCETGL